MKAIIKTFSFTIWALMLTITIQGCWYVCLYKLQIIPDVSSVCTRENNCTMYAVETRINRLSGNFEYAVWFKIDKGIDHSAKFIFAKNTFTELLNNHALTGRYLSNHIVVQEMK